MSAEQAWSLGKLFRKNINQQWVRRIKVPHSNPQTMHGGCGYGARLRITAGGIAHQALGCGGGDTANQMPGLTIIR